MNTLELHGVDLTALLEVKKERDLQQAPLVALIVDLVADHYGLTASEIFGRQTASRVSVGRHMAMVLAVQFTGESLPVIGRYFGRDHTTVMHARVRIAEAAKSNPRVKSTLADLTRRIEAALPTTAGVDESAVERQKRHAAIRERAGQTLDQLLTALRAEVVAAVRRDPGAFVASLLQVARAINGGPIALEEEAHEQR